MQLQPNETRFIATVTAVDAMRDGHGRDVVCAIESVTTSADDDFLGLTPGELRHFYFPGDEPVTPNVRYACTGTMLGGPGHERAVLRTLHATRR